MKNILDTIIEAKKKEVELLKKSTTIETIKSSPFYNRETISLKDALASKPYAIIAEHKRASPSKGMINADDIPPSEIAIGYEQAGATGISVLTDTEFFKAKKDDITLIRKSTSLPILRKEIIIDKYQIFEAKAMGADAILLIASVLNKNQIQELTDLAHTLKLEVLLEIHDAQEIEKIPTDLDIIGINNRNLKTFEVDFRHSIRLCDLLPKELTKISESGISDPKTIIELSEAGFDGFLIGETFMKTHDPGTSCADFLSQVTISA